MEHIWVRGRSYMQLIPWYFGFKSLLDSPWSKIIWEKLPGIPLEYWTIKTLRAIGNSIGTTRFIDPSCIHTVDKWVAWIFIEIAFQGQMAGDIDLVWGQRRHQQRIDYWGVPFRCLICHQTGHIQRNCLRRHRRVVH